MTSKLEAVAIQDGFDYLSKLLMDGVGTSKSAEGTILMAGIATL